MVLGVREGSPGNDEAGRSGRRRVDRCFDRTQDPTGNRNRPRVRGPISVRRAAPRGTGDLALATWVQDFPLGEALGPKSESEACTSESKVFTREFEARTAIPTGIHLG